MVTNTDGNRGQALVYCRVSTRQQEEEGTSLESQEQRCREHAAKLGYTVSRVTREVYTGAELWDRPQLSRDRAELKTGKFQALIVLDNDRLSRDPIHFAIIAQECARAGVELILVNAPLDTSPEGMLIQYVKGYAASIEREKFKERSLRGRLTRVKSGKLPSAGMDLYGYRRDKDAGVRVADEVEGPIVRMIYSWAAEGVPLREIARRLNAQEVPPPGMRKVEYTDPDMVRKWGSGTVHRILRRSDYKGETYCWRWQSADATSPRERPEEEWVPMPPEVSPAIVDPEVWDAVQARLDANKGDWARNQKHQYLLRGLVLCAVCGQRMHVRHHQHGYVVYVCGARVRRGRAGCSSSQVPLRLVEDWVWEQVASILRDPEVIVAELRRREEEGPDPVLSGDLETAKRELAKIERQQERLIQHFGRTEDESFPWELLQEQVKRLQQDKVRLTTMIVDLQKRLAAQHLVIDQLHALRGYCQRVAENLEAFQFEEKRLALEALGIRVLANGYHWNLQGSVPLDGSAVVLSQPRSHECRR